MGSIYVSSWEGSKSITVLLSFSVIESFFRQMPTYGPNIVGGKDVILSQYTHDYHFSYSRHEINFKLKLSTLNFFLFPY